MERPALARLSLWGGSRDVFVVTDPPVGLEIALKEVDTDLEVLCLESQDNYVVVPSLLVFTNDQERAERALGLARRHVFILMSATMKTVSLAVIQRFSHLHLSSLSKPFELEDVLQAVAQAVQRLHHPTP